MRPTPVRNGTGGPSRGSGTESESAQRRLVRTLSPDSAADLWRYLGVFLGRKGRRRLLIQPFLALAVTLTELVVLLSAVRLIVMVAEGRDTVTVSVAGNSLELSFGALAAVALAASAAAMLVRTVESRFVGRVTADAATNARRAVLRTWFDADWEHMREARLGHLQQLLGLNSQQAMTAVNLFAVASLSLLSLAVYGTILLILAPLVALLFLALGAAVAAIFGPMRRAVKKSAKSAARAVSDLQLTATSYAQLNRELHACGTSHAAAELLGEINEQARPPLIRVRGLNRLVPGLIQQTMLSAVVLVVVLARSADVESQVFGAAAILALRSLTYVQQLLAATQNFMEARPYLGELMDTIEVHRELLTLAGDTVIEGVDTIELRDVSFRYSHDATPALSGVDLMLEQGEWLAVVGPSGSGKTTLANLLVGLLRPTSGEILVNGIRASQIARRCWTRCFALLSQEPMLLRTTVGENIAFHRPMSAEAVTRSAKKAAIASDIEELPDGYESYVGDGYSGLSGGQRQRVALARALCDEPACLVLDEPTSALDSRNAQLLEASLANLPPETIVVVISHQPGLLARCQRYVRIEGGQVVASGPTAGIDLVASVGD